MHQFHGKNLRTLDKGLRSNPTPSRPNPLRRAHLNIPLKLCNYPALKAALVFMAAMFLISINVFLFLTSRANRDPNPGESFQLSKSDCIQLSKKVGVKVC